MDQKTDRLTRSRGAFLVPTTVFHSSRVTKATCASITLSASYAATHTTAARARSYAATNADSTLTASVSAQQSSRVAVKPNFSTLTEVSQRAKMMSNISARITCAEHLRSSLRAKKVSISVAGKILDDEDALNVAALRLEHAIFFSSSDLLRYASNSLRVLDLVRSLTKVTNPEMIAYAAIHTTQDDSQAEEADEDDAPALQLCPRCSSRATFSQKQTRSADEGFTIFFECTNAKCRHKWVQS